MQGCLGSTVLFSDLQQHCRSNNKAVGVEVEAASHFVLSPALASWGWSMHKARNKRPVQNVHELVNISIGADWKGVHRLLEELAGTTWHRPCHVPGRGAEERRTETDHEQQGGHGKGAREASPGWHQPHPQMANNDCRALLSIQETPAEDCRVVVFRGSADLLPQDVEMRINTAAVHKKAGKRASYAARGNKSIGRRRKGLQT